VAGKLKVGDRALTYAQHAEVEIVAVQGEWCFCHYIGIDDYLATRMKYLTRIEPAEPQPKYPVGSWVRRNSFGLIGTPMKVIATRHSIEYECRCASGFHARLDEHELELEAVPDCPPCGGKVGDAD